MSPLCALSKFNEKLLEWNTQSPSETGDVVEIVGPGHPLHLAGADLQRHYGKTLPQPALNHWKVFLRATRSEDELRAQTEFEWLLKWVGGELERVAAIADQGTQQSEGSGAAEPPKAKKRRGRKPDTDAAFDKRIADAWKTGSYRNTDELAREVGGGVTGRQVRLALDRHRHRKTRRNNSRR